MILALCDDHLLLLESLATVFAARGHVVLTATEPTELLARLAERPVEVCIIDLVFPTVRSTDVVRSLLDTHPSLKILVLTGFPESVELEGVTRAGVRAVLSKAADVEDIVQVAERVATEAERPAPVFSRQVRARHEPAHLTSREREVLVGLAQGANTAGLARMLGVTTATARSHVQNLLAKLGVHSRLEAVAEALRHNLLMLDDEAIPLAVGPGVAAAPRR